MFLVAEISLKGCYFNGKRPDIKLIVVIVPFVFGGLHCSRYFR